MENLKNIEKNNDLYKNLYKKVENIRKTLDNSMKSDEEIENDSKKFNDNEIFITIKKAFILDEKLLYPIFELINHDSDNLGKITKICMDNNYMEIIISIYKYKKLSDNAREIAKSENKKLYTPGEVKELVEKYKDVILDGGSFVFLIWNKIPNSEKHKYSKYYCDFHNSFRSGRGAFYDFNKNPENFKGKYDFNKNPEKFIGND